MDRAWKSNAQSAAPTTPTSFSIGHPRSQNSARGLQATEPGPWWFHSVTEEIVQAIESAGLAPDATAAGGQLSAAIAAIAARIAATVGGSGAANTLADRILSALVNNEVTGASAVGYSRTFDPPPTDDTVAYKLRGYVDSRDFQAPFQGEASATATLQALLNCAWDALYYQNQVWVGTDAGKACPVVKILPGRYKGDDELTLATGASLAGDAHPANTVSHTRLIMDSTSTGGSGDRRGVPIIRFNRVTHNGAALANGACTMAIQNLEFWYVTMGNDFNNPLGGAAIPFKGYPTGGSLFIDVDMIDSRIKDCCFQHGPAGIRGVNVPNTTTTRGDGFPGGYGINLFISGCEFDAAAIHVWFTNCHLDIEFDNCAFFAGAHIFENCTGRVRYTKSCRFYAGARIDAGDSNNHFTAFVVEAEFSDQSLSDPSIFVRRADFLSITSNMYGATGASSIVAVDCLGGRIAPTIQDSGYNAQTGTNGNDFTAAVKTVGCRNVVVDPVISVAATAANYNGFGLLCLDAAEAPAYGAANASKCLVAGAVAHPYNATPYRGQDRSVNVAVGDAVRWSYDAVRPGEVRTSAGINAGGTVLIPSGQVFGAAYSYDLAAALAASGVYLVTVETQYANNLMLVNSGVFLVTRRTGGGINVIQLGLSNANTVSGVISLAGSVLGFTFTAGTNYYVTAKFNRIADGGVESN